MKKYKNKNVEKYRECVLKEKNLYFYQISKNVKEYNLKASVFLVYFRTPSLEANNINSYYFL